MASVQGQIKELLAAANGEKKLNFVVMIEQQIGLNDPPERQVFLQNRQVHALFCAFHGILH